MDMFYLESDAEMESEVVSRSEVLAGNHWELAPQWRGGKGGEERTVQVPTGDVEEGWQC